ncbi:MAG TPA: DUF362 domain-containing protein [Bryobacteraceae bacterium]|nr:DUF362 domain-containing protein [Bryobacteraceae bacterium]
MRNDLSRRELLACAGAAALSPLAAFGRQAPAEPVSVAECASYGSELLPALERMFDQLGGLGRLVKGKTVAIKLNLTGIPSYRLGHTPAEDAHWTHPRVVAATVHLLGRAGARRIRLLESPWSTADPLEEYMLEASWEPRDILSAADGVEFENTNWLGNAKRYSRFAVPGGGLLFPAYDLNHSYEDCDVFVSIAKMKEHATTGVTLSMKNCFGITPCTIYGDGAGVDEPSEFPKGGRQPLHSGYRQPSKSALPEKDPTSSREGGYRVPRAVADLAAARPIHLAIIEGIHSMAGGEGPWIPRCAPVRPGVMVVGLNAVNTDAVATAVMGFDPMADHGTAPFEKSDSTLRLAEELGVGTRDLRRIEVRGTSIRDALFDFRKQHPAKRIWTDSRLHAQIFRAA